MAGTLLLLLLMSVKSFIVQKHFQFSFSTSKTQIIMFMNRHKRRNYTGNHHPDLIMYLMQSNLYKDSAVHFCSSTDL